MDLWHRLDEAANRWNTLQHPFYVRWSKGTLTRDAIARYAEQYAAAVRALATASRRAADQAPSEIAAALGRHAIEEEDHIALWRRFGDGLGADPNAALEPETKACADTWDRPERDLPATLVALYAIESAQPAIARVKRAGLVEHYGFEPGAGTEYFDVHAVRDVEHAAQARQLVVQLVHGNPSVDLARHGEAVLEANWRLLDGVDRITRS